MKKILISLIITMGSIALLSSCDVLGEKECFCQQFRNGVIQAETTTPAIQGSCSQLNSSLVVYNEGEPILHETKCTELF